MTSEWKIHNIKTIECKDAVLIEGLPGIGNVGKVAIDFLIEKSGAELVASFFSYTLPNTVFVNEKNLVELPRIEVYHAFIHERDFLFMTGDVQPADEVASYQFCMALLDKAKSWNVQNIITLGGIGLQEAPLEPKIYCTGNDETFRDELVACGAIGEVYGVVGPIIGVSGLLLGLTKNASCALLAETYGHPMYLGVRGAKALLIILNKYFSFSYDLADIDDEIARTDNDESPGRKDPKIDTINRLKQYKDMSYIG